MTGQGREAQARHDLARLGAVGDEAAELLRAAAEVLVGLCDGLAFNVPDEFRDLTLPGGWAEGAGWKRLSWSSAKELGCLSGGLCLDGRNQQLRGVLSARNPATLVFKGQHFTSPVGTPEAELDISGRFNPKGVIKRQLGKLTLGSNHIFQVCE